MSSTVKLLKPRTFSTMGYRFERGVETAVPYAVAKHLENDDRFEVVVDRSKAPTQYEREGVDKNGRPVNRNVRLQAIRDAADKLDIDDESNFTSTGLPDARKLTQILGWQVTTIERDEAIRRAPRSAPTAEDPIEEEPEVPVDDAPPQEAPVAETPPEEAPAPVDPVAEETAAETPTEDAPSKEDPAATVHEGAPAEPQPEPQPEPKAEEAPKPKGKITVIKKGNDDPEKAVEV